MKTFQIAVVGINSLFGGTSALLLKQSPFIKCLKLFDPRCLEAAVDLSCINTQCQVKTFLGYDQLENAFQDVDIIVIGDESNEMVDLDSRLSSVTATFRNYAQAIARTSPSAIVVVASTPINCLLPIMSQLLAKNGCYNHNKVVGSTTVDTVRASSLLAARLNLDPKDVVLPVIGGSSEHTRVPVFSQSRPLFSLKKDVKNDLIMDIRRGDSLVLAHKGRPEALNRAYSTVRFLNSIMSGLRGDQNVTDITFCRTDLVPGVEYFSLPVVFGKDGVLKRFGIPKTTETEEEMVEEAIKNVKKDADKAAYIVKGAIELPEQKYLTTNDRASSQKEMFDLYVKCLPKPLNNKPDSISDCVSQNSTDYSFKKLAGEKPTINPFDVPQNKSFRKMFSNKINNVASEDNFFKSGFHPSPFQMPIQILEPLRCPSSPPKLDTDFEFEEFEGDMESEGNFILHEKNLAKTNENKETNRDSVNNSETRTSQTRKSPFSSSDVSQMKTIDPIAKLKVNISGSYESSDPTRNKNSISLPSGKKSTNSDYNANERVKTNILDEDNVERNIECEPSYTKDHYLGKLSKKSSSSSRKRDDETRRQERVASSEPVTEPSLNETGDPQNRVDNFLYDVRAENSLYENYQRTNKYRDKAASRECSVVDSDYYDPDNDEKYKRLVSRLFKKLDRLTEGGQLPLMTPWMDRSSSSKCRRSCTESAVLSSSHSTNANTRSNDWFRPKTEFKIKLPESPFGVREETGRRNYGNDQDLRKKTRKPTPMIKPFLIRNKSCNPTTNIQESTNDIPIDVQICSNQGCSAEVQINPELSGNVRNCVHLVCPKCHHEITGPEQDKTKVISSSQNLAKLQEDYCVEKSPHRNIKEALSNLNDKPSEETVKPRVREVIYNEKRVKSVSTIDNHKKTPLEVELHEERLRKLKEKINKKLMPLLHNNNGNDVGDGVKTPALFKFGAKSFDLPKSVSTSESAVSVRTNLVGPCNRQVHSSFMGTPFVVGKGTKDAPSESSTGWEGAGSDKNKVWQGVPFVVKSKDDKKAEIENTDRHNPETRVMSVENYLGKAKTAFAKLVNADLSPDIEGVSSSKTPKTANKLQLLISKGKLETKLDYDENIEPSGVRDSEKHDKQDRIKREKSELKVEEVRNYMQAKIINNFDRNISLKTGNVDGEKIVAHKPDSDKEPAKFVRQIHETNKKDVSIDPTYLPLKPSPETRIDNPAQEANIAPQTPAKIESNDLKGKGDTDNELVCQPAEVSGKSEKTTLLSEPLKLEDKVEKNGNVGPSPMTSPNVADSSPAVREGESGSCQKLAVTEDNDMHHKDNCGAKVLQRSLITCKSSKATKSSHKYAESLVKPYRSYNKLQMLARAHELGVNNHSKIYSRRRKLQDEWEKTLNPSSNVKKSYSFQNGNSVSKGKLNKKSASVQIAQKRISPTKPAVPKPKLVTKVSAGILDGLKFSFKKPKKSTHNLLKELNSLGVHRASRINQKAKAPSKKDISKQRVIKPLRKVHLCREASKTGISTLGSPCSEGISTRYSHEYSRNEGSLAKMALEVMGNRRLSHSESKWMNKFSDDKFRFSSKVDKESKFRPTGQTARNKLNDFRCVEPLERESKPLGSIDVKSKMMSMPQVRHQLEHPQPPLGPLEVQPGLDMLSYEKISSMFPSSTEDSWEKVLFNEYVRPNLLPSLKDTCETFHLERHPS